MDKRDIIAAGEGARAGESVVPHEPVREFLSHDAPQNDDEAEAQGPDANWTFWQKQIGAALVGERRFRNEALAADRIAFGPDEDRGQNDGEKADQKRIEADFRSRLR